MEPTDAPVDLSSATAAAMADPTLFEGNDDEGQEAEGTVSEGLAPGTGQRPPVQQQPTQQTAEAEGEPFFDASKVPAELQPSYKAMQAAWTKKTQELAQQREAVLGNLAPVIEQMGGIDEVAPLLETLSTPEGVLEWWKDLGQQMTPEVAAQLLGLEAGPAEEDDYLPYDDEGEEGPADFQQDPNQPPPWFLNYLQQQQEAERVAREDAEIESTMDELGVPKDVQDTVALWGSRFPEHLGIKARIQKGYELWQQKLDAAVSSTLQTKETENGKALPSINGGGAPAGGPAPSEDFVDVRKKAAAYVASMPDA